MKIIVVTNLEIGDFVYHVTDPDTKGIIVDIRYTVSLHMTEYLISTAFNLRTWCTTEELSTEKPMMI